MTYGWLLRAFQTSTTTHAADSGKLTLVDVAGYLSLPDAAKIATGVGTGPWTLDGVVVTDVPNGGVDWEVWSSIDVEESTDKLLRNTGTIYKSSNSNSPVVWGSGTKNVFVTPHVEKAAAFFDKLTTTGLIKRASSTSYTTIVTAAFMDTFLATATAALARDSLGVEIGADVQAWDADLDTIAGLAKTSGNVIRGTGAAWASAVLAGADVSTSATAPLTGSTVEAVLDAAGGFFAAAFYRSSASGDVAIGAPTTTFAHGFTSTIPKLVVVHLKCNSNDGSYETGDIVVIPTGTVGNAGTGPTGISCRLDTTNVYLDQNSAGTIRIVSETGGAEETINQANWRFNIYAYA